MASVVCRQWILYIFRQWWSIISIRIRIRIHSSCCAPFAHSYTSYANWKLLIDSIFFQINHLHNQCQRNSVIVVLLLLLMPVSLFHLFFYWVLRASEKLHTFIKSFQYILFFQLKAVNADCMRRKCIVCKFLLDNEMHLIVQTKTAETIYILFFGGNA